MKRVGIILFSIVSFSSLVFPLSPVSAVSGSEWQAGRIIDDTVFTERNSMSVADIQSFLNQKVGVNQTNSTPGVCDTNGIQPSEYGGGTRAQWGAAHGTPAPFTCLKDYYEVPKTSPGSALPASNYGGKAIPPGALSAAQIIYNAAQKYSINPKVLLTLLQKESVGPLVTDAWPTQSQYAYPMGAHCPDSTGCDPNYAGFSIQVSEAAKLFRSYLDGMDQPWWGCTDSAGNKIQCPANAQAGAYPGGGYKVPYATNFILWSPSTSCGGANINIQSQATAALYMYTPYQPNQAALINLYGKGDGCSSYGNRNFWVIFNNWFGTTLGFTIREELINSYNSLGGVNGELGKALDSGFCNDNHSVCWQQFANGYLVFSSATGAWESKGAIRAYWASIGYQGSKLGFPIGHEQYKGNGLWQQEYQNGFIIGSDTTGYWASMGKIRDRWGQLGYESSSLGLPVDEEVDNTDGSAWQQYEHGFIVKASGASLAWESKGAIRAYWASIGYQGGKAGWPTGGEQYDSATKTWSQTYQKGVIYFSDLKGGWFTARTSTS